MSPKTLNEREVETFLKSAKSDRYQLLIMIMLDAGLRVNEVVQLRKSDLWQADAPAHTIYVRPEIAKGRISRFVPTTERIKAAITAFDSTGFFSETLNPNGFAFPGRDMKMPISTRQVERVTKIVGLKSINRPVNPHMLRHTFATRLMRVTNARVVQELLGHKKLTSTQIYTHPNSDDLTSAIDSLSKKP